MPPTGVAAGLPFQGKRNARVMSEQAHFGTFGGMLAEHSSHGKVIPSPLDRQRHLIFYNISGDDKKKFKFITEVVAEIWFSLGAKTVFTQIASFPEIRTPRDLTRFKRTKVRINDYLGATAYHAKGTCRMGSDPENSVVKHTGETWDVENLFITDASIVPTSLGVNPQMTIYALATRCSGFIDDKLETSKARKQEAKAGMK